MARRSTNPEYDLARARYELLRRQSVTIQDSANTWRVELDIESALRLYDGELHSLITNYLDRLRNRQEREQNNLAETKAIIKEIEKLGFK